MAASPTRILLLAALFARPLPAASAAITQAFGSDPATAHRAGCAVLPSLPSPYEVAMLGECPAPVAPWAPVRASPYLDGDEPPLRAAPDPWRDAGTLATPWGVVADALRDDAPRVDEQRR